MTTTKMTTTDEAQISLEEAKGENGLLVMFSCNTCPVVLGWQYRFNEVAEAFGLYPSG